MCAATFKLPASPASYFVQGIKLNETMRLVESSPHTSTGRGHAHSEILLPRFEFAAIVHHDRVIADAARLGGPHLWTIL